MRTKKAWLSSYLANYSQAFLAAYCDVSSQIGVIMIRDFSEYITQHMTESGLSHRPSPGEHHFVSIYLVPRLYRINKRVPDYVNPDGTKKVIGDVVYYKDHEHQLGIEVKLGTVRLTKNEFNTWIVNSDEVEWPHTFFRCW